MDSYSSQPSGVPPEGSSYSPTPDESDKIRETERFYTQSRADRRVYEQQWFINSAYDRGNHYVEWNDKFQRLTIPSAPPHRVRIKDNRIQAKNRARTAKLVKNRPKPIVVPATSEYDDYLNCRATQKGIDYTYRRTQMEQKVLQVLIWARNCSKGFLWYHWDDQAKGRVMIKDPQTGINSYQEAILGDIEFEVGSPFEVLVREPGIARIGDQPEIIRVKLRDVADMQKRYPDHAPYISAMTKDQDAFRYERQIAVLNPLGLGTNPLSRSAERQDDHKVMVKEHFIAPCAKYPQGHYRVLVGPCLVKLQDFLPYGFDDMSNPYPVTEFADMQMAGQFWNATICEQAIDIQKQLNLMLSKIAEHVRLMAFPKILVPKQAQLQKSSWTSEAGEIVEYVDNANLKEPKPWYPPPILGDVWKMVQYLAEEFDNIYQIWPVSEGSSGGTTSGFQANLLQEAANTVHGLDIRALEQTLEEWARKVRRMMKQGYEIPRLLAVTGANYEPDVLEFSASQIDEYADLAIEIGTGLSDMKAQRQDLVMQLYNSGIMGDQNDPDVKRRTLGLLELGSVESAFNLAKGDENQAQWENIQVSQAAAPPPQPPPMDPMTGGPQVDPQTGMPVQPPFQPPIEDPHFYENHLIHYNMHTMWLKSPEGKSASPYQRYAMTRHCVLHGRFINPSTALQLAEVEGITDVIPMLQQMLMATQPPAGAPPGAPPQAGPQGPPPQGPPQVAGAPPPPPQVPGPPGVQ